MAELVGALAATPRARVAPSTEAELVAYLRTATGPVRPVGSGHSFSPLVPTQGDLLVLDRMRGIVDTDAGAYRAQVRAGTRLADLGPLLDREGQACENLPDIDRQTLAGALSQRQPTEPETSRSLAGYVEAIRIVTPSGEVRELDASEPELLAAAAVSLGSLGIVTEARLANRPTYRLQADSYPMRLDEVLERFDELVARHRHFEFFPLPHCDWASVLSIDEAPEDAPTHNPLPTPEDAELRGALDLLLATPTLARRTLANEIAQPSLRRRPWTRAIGFYATSATCASTRWSIRYRPTWAWPACAR